MTKSIPEHRLISIDEKHLKLVWQWRNSPRVRKNMHNSAEVEWQVHIDWFDKLQNDEARKVFVLLQNQRPIGVLNFSDMHTTMPQWGCYLGETNVWPGSGIILEIAALDFSTNYRHFSHLLAQVLSFNQSANKMHELFEYDKVRIEKGGERDGASFEIYHYSYDLTLWTQKRQQILNKLPKNFIVASNIQFLE